MQCFVDIDGRSRPRRSIWLTGMIYDEIYNDVDAETIQNADIPEKNETLKNDNVIKNDSALSNQQVPAELYEIENEETGIKMRFKKVKKKKDLSR